jgi:hypothetical protein
MKALLQLVIGFAVAVALMVFAVVLWLHTLIIFAAPVGFLSVGVAWVSIDNRFVYHPARPPATDVASSTQPDQQP